MHGPPSNIDALRAFAGNLDGIQAVHPPDASGASIVMALGRDRAGHSVTFAGCGLSLDEAFVSCVGEAAEWSAQNARQRPLAKAAPALPAIADFDQLFAESPVHAEWVALDGLCGTPDGRAPRDLFVAGAPLRLPLSHGCAAGSNPDAALFGALCEWVERDAALAWWSGQRRAQGACAAAEEAAQDWLTEARQKNPGRVTVLLDIGAGSAVPVMAAASFDRDGGAAAFGMKAHGNPAKAATGALRELVQMEFGLRLSQMKLARQGKDALAPGDLATLRRAGAIGSGSVLVTPAACLAGTHPGAGDEDPRRLATRLGREGRHVWACRLDDEPGIAVVRALVTGLRAPLRNQTGCSGIPALY